MKFDVLINGGGMVGLALGLLLPKSLKIGIIDPLPPESGFDQSADFDARVSAISRRSQRILQQCGVWQELPQQRITPYHSMQVWDANGTAELNFTAQQVAEPNLGFIIENRLLRSLLYREAEQRSNIDLVNDSLVSFSSDQTRCRVKLASGQSAQGRLLVGADGARSKVRELANIQLQSHDYQQTALVANIRTSKSHQFTAWQRFLPSGPIAYLPLPDEHLSSIVWTLDTTKMSSIDLSDQRAMNSRISAALDYRLGEVDLITPVNGFPLVARHASSYLADRVVLLGDAAHAIHPLAGQGVNLGFADAVVLAEVIGNAESQGYDFAKRSHLRSYERRRKGENHLTEKSMTALNWCYKQADPASILLRNFGVKAINNLTMVKRQLMHQALGIG